MSTIKTNTIETQAGGTSVLTLGTSTQTLKILGGTPGASKVLTSDATGGATWGTAAAGGKVLQCIQVNKDDEWTVTGTTMTDITGMTATITPSAVTSKVLLMVTLNFGGDSTATHVNQRTFRDAVQIAMGAVSGSRSRNTASTGMGTHVTSTIAFNWLDEPATTSATVYKLQASANNAGAPIYLNRSKTNTDNSGYAITVSSITLMEIGV